MLVYAVDSERSFQQAQETYARIRKDADILTSNTAITKSLMCVLVGNKTDLEGKVPWSQAQTWARQHCVPLFMCSAKTGQGLTEAFDECVGSWFRLNQASDSIQ